MKKLGIEIDEVIRKKLEKFDLQYRKVFVHNAALVAMDEQNFTVKEFTNSEVIDQEKMIKDKERELITLPVDSPNLISHYKFDSKSIEMFKGINSENYDSIEYTPKQNLDKFLFEDYPFQIFGNADEFESAMNTINKIQHIGLTTGKFEVILFSTLKHKAISATYFFLSNKNCRIKKIMFLENDLDKWNYCDVMVDVLPDVFQNKPEGKIAIKINKDFNQWNSADFSFNTIKELDNETFLNRIFN